jgi:predicted dehydrogenase
MTNWGAHHLDIAQWALGMDESGPVEIQATGGFDTQKRFETPSSFDITYKYGNGTVIECKSPTPDSAVFIPDKKQQLAELLNGKTSFTGCIFEGEKGLLYVNRGALTAWPDEILEAPLKESDTRLYSSKNHHQDWIDCIKSRKQPICDVAIGHRSATVCHLGNMAIQYGKKIQWDPVKEQVVGDSVAAKLTSRPYRGPWKLA